MTIEVCLARWSLLKSQLLLGGEDVSMVWCAWFRLFVCDESEFLKGLENRE